MNAPFEFISDIQWYWLKSKVGVFYPFSFLSWLLPCFLAGIMDEGCPDERQNFEDERNDSALLQCFPFQLIPISWFTFRSTGGYLRPTTYCWVSLANIGRWNLEPFLLAKTTVSTAWCSVWNSGTHSGQQTDPSSRFRFRLNSVLWGVGATRRGGGFLQTYILITLIIPRSWYPSSWIPGNGLTGGHQQEPLLMDWQRERGAASS